MNYGIDSIHHYSVIAIKFSRSHTSLSGLCRFSASINHKSRGKMSPSRDSYVVYPAKTRLQSFPALRKCVGASLGTAESSQLHMAGE